MTNINDESKVILWLDDDPNRTALMYNRMNQKDKNRVIWCKTAKEAISVLRDYHSRLDFIYLDHDLAEGVEMALKNTNSGMEVVRWLEHTSNEILENLKNAIFIVHTHNYFCGRIMKERLLKLGMKVKYVPFGSNQEL